MFIPFLAFLGIILLLPLYFVAGWLLDELVRLEYTYHRQDWQRDGKPWGFTWRPPEHRRGTGPNVWPFLPAWRWSDRDWCAAENAHRCALVWLFRTPAWMRQDRKALRLVLWYRAMAFVFGASVAAYALAFFYVVVRAVVTEFS